MLKKIITYPTPPSVEFATDVRLFDTELFTLIDDLKDTIKENNLDALAAFQIGSYFNVVVIKQEDDFLELINPRVLNTSGSITTVESTAYFPGLTSEVKRYDNISLVYQDRYAKQHSLKASGEFSVLVQRKIDYTFGATFLSKLNKEQTELFEKKLEFGSDILMNDSCPSIFKRDYIVKIINIFTIGMLILLLVSLFISDNNILSKIWSYQIYLSFSVIGLNIFYFFYAHYEARQYTSCISCQSGNIIGTTLISLGKLTLIMLISYFLIN